MPEYKDIETKLICAGEPRPRIRGAVAMPIFQSATFETDEDRDYSIVGEGLQDPPHPVSSSLLEPLGHEPHPDKEETYSSNEAEYQLLSFHKYSWTFLGD